MEVEVIKTEKNWNLGEYAVKGGPGRPRGLKNKFTQLKETLLDAFNSEPEAIDALKRTLFVIRSISSADGKSSEFKKCVDMEALRAIISVLPKEKEDDEGGSTINFNLILAQFSKFSTEELRSLIALGRARDSDRQVSAEGSGAS